MTSKRGHPLTKETRKKISQANKGKKKPPRSSEHCRHLSEAKSGPNNPNYGKKFSEQTKQRMREAHAHAHDGRRRYKEPWNKGKPLSREHRKHIAEARRGKPHPHKGR
jgi:hypothetical protein